MPDILDHVEKTVADNYRKEIDQEENVWRTLPFFVAALSLEVAELTQVKDQLTGLPPLASGVASFLGTSALVSTLAAIYYLYRSIRFAEFKYLAREPELVSYASQIQHVVDVGQATSEEGMTMLKRELARQYAISTDNNRSINQHRVGMRTAAGIATLASLLAILLLGAVTVGAHVWTAGVTQIGNQHVTPSTGKASFTPKSSETGDAGTSQNESSGKGSVYPTGVLGNQ